MKNHLTEEELEEVYSPKEHEIHWSETKARGPLQQLGILVLLKTTQNLGFFITVHEVQNGIVQHIARKAKLLLPTADEWQKYSMSRTCERHYAFVREYLEIRKFNQEARQLMVDIMDQLCWQKDDPADLINAAIEELIHHRYELPVYNTLKNAAHHARKQSYQVIYDQVIQDLSDTDKKSIDQLFQSVHSFYSPWNQLKEDAKQATLHNLKEIIEKRDGLIQQKINTTVISQAPLVKIKQLAAEAKTLDASSMVRTKPGKRYALATALIFVQLSKLLDDIGEMCIKRMMSVHKRARKHLKEYKEQNQKRTDALVATLHDVLLALQSEDEAETKVHAIQQVLEGKQEQVLRDCEVHLAYSGDNYYVFLWQFYKSHRATLFQILRTVSLCSTNQDQGLVQAIEFLKANQHAKKEHLTTVHIEKKGKLKKDWEITPLLDLSWVPDAWWRWLCPKRKKGTHPEQVNRRHFEACVFAQIMWGLKSGDLYIEGSEKYADYRKQLISWEEYEQNVSEFCQKVNLPTSGDAFVKQMKAKFQSIAKKTDTAFPHNKQVRVENGEVVIGKLKRQKTPPELKKLESYIAKKLEPIHMLDMLADTEYWLNWSRFFGPISGHDAKLDDPVERYLTTVFCYGCNLGPTQTARSLGTMDRKQLSWINQRHITGENLDKAIQFIINSYNQFLLPTYWGDGKSASADGTQWDLYEKNLLSERHIRYGGYGGIGYYHVSDTYIALFSHFIPCGVWEGVYILDILMNEKSEIQPEILHADTQGQSATVFGLSALLGIELMPRIRNWKDLKLFLPTKEDRYQHIDELFTDVIDWDVIKFHYPDMLRVAMSIEAGKIFPSTILNKLGTYSRRNKLYQAFQALGHVKRTLFLLQYMADEELRSTIQAATNKSEAFNGFTKWLAFGGEGIIAENDREKQRKFIKFNHLVANCLIFYNVFALSHILHEYHQEGNKYDEELLGDLSPYLTAHVNRFGKYRLDLERKPLELQFDLPIYQTVS